MKLSMKHNIITTLFTSICLLSCTEDDTDVVQPNLVLVNALADSSILNPGQTFQFSSNRTDVNWSTSKGNISSGGSFTAPVQNAKVILTASVPQGGVIKRTYFVSSYKPLFDSMLRGGYVLSFRHADASNGSDQSNSVTPEWWKSCNNTLARQLTNPTGYTQSNDLGAAMKIFKLPVSKIISSEYCRCTQTAENFNFQNVPIVTDTAITLYVYNNFDANRYVNQINLINNTPIDNKNTILIGHAGFPSTPNPQYLNNLGWGDAAVFKLNTMGAATYVTTLNQFDLRQMLVE
jgi:phosphohistidine phosphatase SixA